ncbi:MAG: hypothetical protein P8Y30_01170, partial [candidate division WOR-3 bacterium]
MDDETWSALKEMGLVSSVPEGEVLNVYSKVLNKVISYPNPDVNGSNTAGQVMDLDFLKACLFHAFLGIFYIRDRGDLNVRITINFTF